VPRSRRPGAAAPLARLRGWPPNCATPAKHVGFYFITNHGIPQAQIDAVFRPGGALPRAARLAQRSSRSRSTGTRSGLPADRRRDLQGPRRSTATPSTTSTKRLFIRREPHTRTIPDVIAGVPWRGLNQWPAPTCRVSARTVLDYQARDRAAWRSTCWRLYDIALDMPAGFFRARFRACAHELAAVALPAPTWRRRTTSSASRRTPNSGFMTFSTAVRRCRGSRSACRAAAGSRRR